MNNEKKKRQVKHKFTAWEDDKIRELVAKYGTENWKTIANNMENRDARQIRERWTNYLKPCVNSDTWTKTEENLLNEKIKEFGPKWRMITRFFNGRTEVSLKNHYRLMIRRSNKEERKQKKQIEHKRTKEVITPEQKIAQTIFDDFAINFLDESFPFF